MFLFAVIPFYLFCSISKMSTFFAGRLQLPMEALCVSLSLFSNQIKKMHR